MDIPNEQQPEPQPQSNAPAAIDPSGCVILVPFSTYIMPACERGLRELERRGYEVRRVGGYSAIDQGRNQMATDALAAGFEETFWIDSDIDFPPDAVDRLRGHRLPITGGICARKGARGFNIQYMPRTTRLKVGQGAGPCEMLYVGTGFLYVRSEVYRVMKERLAMPTCNEQFGRPMIPFFLPMVHSSQDGPWYLAEDYAFCERARQCGFKIMADTSIRLWHIGEYAYGWEDAGAKLPRRDSFVFLVAAENKPGPPRLPSTDRLPTLKESYLYKVTRCDYA